MICGSVFLSSILSYYHQTYVRQRADDVLALDVRHAADLVEALQSVRLRLRSEKSVQMFRGSRKKRRESYKVRAELLRICLLKSNDGTYRPKLDPEHACVSPG